MNEYGKQRIKGLTEVFRGKGLTVEEHGDASFSVTTRLGSYHLYTWIKEDEFSLVSQFPELQCAVIRYTVKDERLRYRLFVQKGGVSCVFEADLPIPHSNERVVNLYRTLGSLENERLPVESFGKAFAEWIQQLPDYRLRFVTGEWELIGEFSS